MALNLTVIYGSVRTARQGIKAARFLVRELEGRGHTVTLLDPAELRLPLLDRMYKEFDPGTAPQPMQTIADAITGSDGFVFCSGEYNHGIPPALKNLIDHFLEEWFHRPSAICCYSAGRFGGVRAAMALRMTLAEIGTVSIPTMFPIARVQDEFEEDGTPTDPKMRDRIRSFFDELEWYARSLKDARASGLPGSS